MRPDDLLIADTSGDPWSATSTELRRDLLESAIKGEAADEDDLELADALVRLAHRELEGFATQGNVITEDADSELLLRACSVACKRVGVDFPDLPFRDFSGFYKYWRREGMAGSGSWAARREYLDGVFEPVEDALLNLSVRSFDDGIAVPISPRTATGWAVVDREIRELRRRFEVARSEQDHSAVGTACVRILEHLGDVCFDSARHLPAGVEAPPRDKTKARFDMVISAELTGTDNETLRRLARTTVELAHQVKHRTTPSRRDAGIAADSVVLLANMMRRIVPLSN
ncbi:hypothetical protein L1857_08630 [Amycolatopsis thermalba]|uniref:Abortive infection protein-like C-terminal domain-containing protein n=1 Tax=Amycolatopsis thermalba TaxID=944492 RepID=A0ABY4NS73_9PSEU|nr:MULTISPECIES: hypothetical protein [Amycolatopsis]UQS22878.1 hypothetical protein L1857_08630 [Amycolatopsis thermalba]